MFSFGNERTTLPAFAEVQMMSDSAFTAAVVGVITNLFVRFYEEPTLRSRFGDQYEAYRQAVPGWWPRLHPWESG